MFGFKGVSTELYMRSSVELQIRYYDMKFPQVIIISYEDYVN